MTTKAMSTLDITHVGGRQNLDAFVDAFDGHSTIVIVGIDRFRAMQSVLGDFDINHISFRLYNTLYTNFKDTYDFEIFNLAPEIMAVVLKNSEMDFFVENALKTIYNDLKYVPFTNGEKHFYIETFMGVASGICSKELLKQAESAFFSYTKDHYLCYKIFNNMSYIETNEKLFIWNKIIVDALSNNKILLYFHPVVDNSTGYVAGFEALVRLEDSLGNIHLPYAFLDISKELKLYDKITCRVLELALDAIRLYDTRISVNITYEDIIHLGTAETIFNILDSNSDITDKLLFEITEVAGIEDYDIVNSFISSVKTYGSMILIDDFGDGYSTFSRILKLNVDGIKITGDLIKNINSNPKSLSITKHISNLAQELSWLTVAEFVTDKSVYMTVCDLGINYSQGFGISKPLRESEITNFVRTIYAFK